ncbi:MAG: NADH-quinone oxidoreductase subunit C [Deltaproteobacteria bacterium]
MEETRETLLTGRIKDNFKDAVLSTAVFRGEVTHLIEKGALLAILNFLKTDPELKFNFLVDVLGADYPEDALRFEVVYHLYSIPRKHRLRIKVRLSDAESLPSVSRVWTTADWHEREVFDMFGISFDGHPDLKRIYLPDDWDGFPLRKDYPLRGFKDRYNPFGVEKK